MGSGCDSPRCVPDARIVRLVTGCSIARASCDDRAPEPFASELRRRLRDAHVLGTRLRREHGDATRRAGAAALVPAAACGAARRSSARRAERPGTHLRVRSIVGIRPASGETSMEHPTLKMRPDRSDRRRSRRPASARAVERRKQDLDAKLLRTFVTIVDLRSFTRAGRRLGLSQSAISQQIGAQERQLGVKLLVRAGTGVRPTPAGRAPAALRAADSAEGRRGAARPRPPTRPPAAACCASAPAARPASICCRACCSRSTTRSRASSCAC